MNGGGAAATALATALGRAFAACAAAAAVLVAALGWEMVVAVRQRADGQALYEGRAVLAARLAGPGGDALPSDATRCSNCHDGQGAIGPALERATLLAALPRRGGPPSRYDAAALCRLLREGIDPAHVMLPRVMPRYQIDDGACLALWRFLSAR